MKWSLSLGRIFGIKLSIHWTFIILLGFIFITQVLSGMGFSGAMLGVGYILTVFACIVLHELGHALTAKRFNIVTKNITLLPIGGLAMMERMPEKPGQEFLIAIAGPMVNVVIAFGLYLFLIFTGGIPSMEELKTFMETQSSMITGEYFLFNLMAVNLFICLFNMIPAFPMDGGRILRAILCYIFNRSKATIIAARIGQFFAVLLIFAGFYVNFLLIFIGIFIFLSAGGESIYEAAKSVLSGYKVKDVFRTHYKSLSPSDKLEKVINMLFNEQNEKFLVIDGNTVKGVLTSKNVINALSEFGKDTPVSNVMEKDFPVFQTETELVEVYDKMMINRTMFSPVYDNGQLVGVVDKENIDNLILVKQALSN